MYNTGAELYLIQSVAPQLCVFSNVSLLEFYQWSAVMYLTNCHLNWLILSAKEWWCWELLKSVGYLLIQIWHRRSQFCNIYKFATNSYKFVQSVLIYLIILISHWSLTFTFLSYLERSNDVHSMKAQTGPFPIQP